MLVMFLDNFSELDGSSHHIAGAGIELVDRQIGGIRNRLKNGVNGSRGDADGHGIAELSVCGNKQHNS